MNFWLFLRKARVALINLDRVLEAFYKNDTLTGELNAARAELSTLNGKLADFNLRRQLFLNFSSSELPTRQEDLADFFRAREPVDTNHELIRVGGPGDGGYLVPDDLEGITSLFSPGVDQTSTFELFFAERGVICYLADGSVDGTPISDINFKFTKKFVHHGATTELWMNFEDWVRSNSQMDGNSILQIDIEGGEWQILSQISEDVLLSFRILVIEFHGLHHLAYSTSFETIRKTFDLLEKHFDLVHLHANNAESTQHFSGFEVPPLLEVTYIRKDRVSSRIPKKNYFNSLDKKNVDSQKDVPLGAFKKGA